MAPCRLSLLLLAVLTALGWSSSVGQAQKQSPEAVEFFEKRVRPLLAEHCFSCHGGDKKVRGHSKLTSRATVLEGGESGPAAIAGKPDQSLLIRAIRYQEDLRMPPKAKLKDQDVATLTRWVAMGLPWSHDAVVEKAVERGKFHITDEQRRFWAFQPVRALTPPPVKDSAWPRSGLDRFILAGLEAKGLRPAPQADRRTLIRRATFDLTGLPPTPEEVDAFLRDESPGAFARVVDRLLASPHYGERWGRHWLDLVRYADSFDARLLGGPPNNEMDMTEAWRYRDWVVNAMNRDMPYDQFLVQQLAGDLLPGPDPGSVNAEGIVATGVLAIGNWGGGDADKEKMVTDIVDDQLDVVGRVFMGLTVTCARCHDHKFDPISQADYYGLAGIFFSTHILPSVGPRTNGPPMLRIPLISAAEAARRQQYKSRMADLDKQIKTATAEQYRDFARAMLPQTSRYVTAAWEYQNRPAGERTLTVPEFAARRRLQAWSLRQWIEYLNPADYRLMTVPVRDVAGRVGVHSWRGQPDCPNVLANSTAQVVTIATFKLPPRSVAVHPGPNNGVAVGWRSPITGTVKIGGRVADADPMGGDGIAWIIDHSQAGGVRELASGDIPDGGAQAFSRGKLAAQLASVEVKAGDMIHLLVLPKANYTCDTTVVELTITKTDGSAAWDLTRDVVDNLHQGNPHTDRQGNAGVWHFYDMAESNRAKSGGSTHPALAAWRRVATGNIGRDALEAAARDFQKSFDLADERSPFWIRNVADAQALPAEGRASVEKLKRELDTLKKTPPPPIPVAHGAQEGGIPDSTHPGIHDVRIHVRGSYLRLTELVPRRLPEVLAGESTKLNPRGSGRLELARWLARAEHPLTARVMVNRIWQHHFGEGLVRTPSNFGKLGQAPTHPELLDWLADQFVTSGWSMKQMHRMILLSATYQQASEPSAETQRLDTDNRLWGRMNRHRLEAEALRDSLLAVAGRLDRTAGGPATRDFNNPRRSLYQMTVRSDRSGFGPLFDTPDSTSLSDKRVISTVAPQALFLLNHPFVLEQTQTLAKRLQREAGDNRERIRRAYALLYGRAPTSEESQIGVDFLARAGSEERVWEEYCQVLLCANEFIYVD